MNIVTVARRLAVLAAVLAAGCVSPSPAPAPAPVPAPAPASGDRQALAHYGIVVQGLHLSAHGYVLDLRYRVQDPAKAALLLDQRNKVQLLDEVRHASLGVPESPVIGGMRQTSRNHVVYTDRDYFILFVNPGRAVKPGDAVQLAVGDQRIARLTVH